MSSQYIMIKTFNSFFDLALEPSQSVKQIKGY